MQRDVLGAALAVGIALMVLGMLVLGSTAGSSQTACEARTQLDLSLAELEGLNLDATGDAAIGGAVAAVGSATKNLARATDTSGSPQYTALASKFEGVVQAFSTVDDDRSITIDRALVQQTRTDLVREVEAYEQSLRLSC